MKVETTLLNQIKEILINPIYSKMIIDEILYEIPNIKDLSQHQKVNYLRFTLSTKFNTELCKIERHILYHKKKSDLLVFLFQFLDLTDEVIELSEERASDYREFEKSYHNLRPFKNLQQNEDDNIANTDQFLFYMITLMLIEDVKQLKVKTKKLFKKYDIIYNISPSERVNMIRSFKEKEKIYIKNYELLAAAIAVEIELNGLSMKGNKKPTNEEIFEYINEHFWVNNKAKKKSAMKTKTMISYFSDRNGYNYKLERFEKYLEAFKTVLKSID